MPRTMVVVFAHPDDDAYGIAGTVALHAADTAFRFVLVLATDGEAGDIREGFPATQDTLGAVRRAEDPAAWQALGRVPDRHEWLGYPDGKLPDVPFDQLVDRIAGILAEEQPDVVATFGPDGIFGHPDHITVGAATDAAFMRLAPGAERGFRRLCHGVIPDSVFTRWNEQRAAMNLPVFNPAEMYHMRGVPDQQIGITVDTRAVSGRIVAGLSEHRSQHHVIIDDPIDIERWNGSSPASGGPSPGPSDRPTRRCSPTCSRASTDEDDWHSLKPASQPNPGAVPADGGAHCGC